MDNSQKAIYLKKYFGYEQFREGQESLIDHILQGRDTLGIMPTGAGKSICYQIPALIFEGITLVISPLISLMKDQVRTLNEAGIHAAYLNSSLSRAQYLKALSLAGNNRYKIIYVAPERLSSEEFLDFAGRVSISMVCVDEAHCVSQWGQDFRPSYLKITEFIRMLPQRPVVSAFTATATREVREDIISMLALHEPYVLTTGFDRKNLFFAVKKPKNKLTEVIAYISEHNKQSGIIYCATRKDVEEVCSQLDRRGVPVTRYHAGLSEEERRQNQDDFIYDRKPVMVATNAFGMGIDKSNVRYVIHYNMPKNVESYYQEAGRAGRDGEEAECILLYAPKDVRINQFLIDQNTELDRELLTMIKERDRERLKQMTFYTTTNQCLRDYMLRYFGEYGAGYCGKCSNCLTEFEERDVTEIAGRILQCVASSYRSFGMTVITDTLRGSASSRLKQSKMTENICYGTLREVPVFLIRQVMNHLLLEGYLQLSDDEYPVLACGEFSEEVVRQERPVIMKIAKEKKAAPKPGGKNNTNTMAGEVNYELFERLRGVRLRLAREEQMPPYIIFSDKALKEMSVRMPKNEAEFLNISGVGEVKCRKYGAYFLQEINQFFYSFQ